MVSSRKRSLREVDTSPETPSARATHNATKPSPRDVPKEDGLLHRIRNSWQFANLCQWIYIFGKALKIDESLDVDELEAACLSPDSTILLNLGLSLLKWVSSHRGLTPELFDEYTRRQYVAKAPHRNPFGTDELPAKFVHFDVFTKLRVLHQLTRWVMLNPDRIRDKMGHPRDMDQTSWRIEPFGWDSKDRTYFVLDDNRLYRMTNPPPAAPPKKNTLKAKAARRASKRRRISTTNGYSADADDAGEENDINHPGAEDEYDRLGGVKWECIAVTLEEVRHFVSTLRRTRDENEKILRDQIEEFLMPILEKQEESRKRKAAQRERELLALEKMAHAKRSSRIASRMQQKQAEERAHEEEERRREEEKASAKEEARRLRIEKERDLRLISREQRLKEREARRLQHEEELAQLSGDSRSQSGRLSNRQLQHNIERNKKALDELQGEEEDWIFDCICGVYGHVDDGTHSVSCEQCNVWQHSKCLGISEEEAERDDFNFVCSTCLRRHKAQAEVAAKPRPVIKLKVSNPGSSPATPLPSSSETSDRPPHSSSSFIIAIPASVKTSASVGNEHSHAQHQEHTTAFRPISSTSKLGPAQHPFSSPHPTLSPPQQSPVRSRAYSSIFAHSSPTSRETMNGDGMSSPSRPAGAIQVPKHGTRSDGQTPDKNGDEARAHRQQQEMRDMPTLSQTLQQHPGSERSFSASQDAGMSPTKFSPPRPSTGGSRVTGNPLPSVLPPVAALSPSLHQPIHTPPVKQQAERPPK